ncbi:hypothetical protein SAMN02990966_05349 [Rhodospirillales bacterium URHD0017]|nr:hypothetical protein SAMN02990966_05349 [Rhodospirillales bacterium URHD0017]
MSGLDEPLARLAERYRRFAADEAHGVSPHYERLAEDIAASADVLRFLIELPPPRRQPNLLLGAATLIAGRPPDIASLTEMVARRADALRAVMLARTTQTNEPARCAVLLPLLAALPQPLALIEVGASAGLCLLPDRYGYDWGSAHLPPTSADAPVFRCTVTGPAPLPTAQPRVVWRAGLDLNPLDVASDEDMAWLEALIWPEQDERRRNLRAALAVARRDPPRVVRGDLLKDLEPLMAEAPAEATLVVFHTAVLAYVTPPEVRQRFVDTVRASRAVWISNETPRVFPEIAARASQPAPHWRFLLAVDGEPKAWTGPHGQSLEWLPGRQWNEDH